MAEWASVRPAGQEAMPVVELVPASVGAGDQRRGKQLGARAGPAALVELGELVVADDVQQLAQVPSVDPVVGQACHRDGADERQTAHRSRSGQRRSVSSASARVSSRTSGRLDRRSVLVPEGELLSLCVVVSAQHGVPEKCLLIGRQIPGHDVRAMNAPGPDCHPLPP